MKTNFKKISLLLVVLFSAYMQQANAQDEKEAYVIVNTGYSMDRGQGNLADNYTGDYRNSEISTRMILTKPTLVFRTGSDKINPCAKIGIIIVPKVPFYLVVSS